MKFKMPKPFYKIDNTPIYSKDLDGEVLGMAQSNGTILIDRKLSPFELRKHKTIEHEKIHIDQMRRGDLNYDDKNVYWKGKVYPRSKMKEGAKNLPWEKEAYKKQ